MALTVRTNVASMMAGHQLGRTNSSLGGTLERISSGLRINRAADDAAGLGVSTNLQTIRRSTQAAVRNAYDGVSIVTVAEGATNESTDILHRMRELAVQSSSETLDNDERAYIQDEFTALRSEMDRIASATEFNGVQLSDGSVASLDVQVGVQNATDSQIAISLADLTSTTLGVSTGVTLASVTGAQSAIDTIDTALDTVNGYRSDYGAVQNRLDSAISNAETYIEMLSAAESRIKDADFASETTEMTKLQILQQSGVAALAQAKNMNSSVVQLLQ